MRTSYNKWLEDSYLPIAGGALESNIMGLWFAKQSAKGSFVTFTTGTKRGRWVGGDLQVNRADGEEAWSDQTLFADHVDFVNTFIGAGAPVIQGQSSLIAYLCWLAMGQETVTGGTNAQIDIKATAEVTGGEFAIQLKTYVGTFKTAKIKSTATAAEVWKAMTEVFPGVWQEANAKAAGGPVTKANVTPITLKFEKELAAQPVNSASLSIVESTLVGGVVSFEDKVVGKLYKHVATPSNTGGFYFGIFKSVGKSVVYRAQFNDCRAQSLRIEGSSASKVVKVTPTVLSLNPGEVQSADPSTLDDGLKPFIYTEAAGALEIDGVAYHGQTAFAFLFSWGLNEFYGDQVHPFDVINNVASAAIEGLTLLIDQAGLERYNSVIYGTTTPSAKATPLETLPLLGSYKVKFARTSPFTGSVTESLIIEMPGVKWTPTLAIPANPAGGAVELAFTGAMRKEGGGAYLKTPKGELVPFRVTAEEYLDPAFTE